MPTLTTGTAARRLRFQPRSYSRFRRRLAQPYGTLAARSHAESEAVHRPRHPEVGQQQVDIDVGQQHAQRLMAVRSLDDLELRDRRIADAFDFPKPRGRRRYHLGEGTEPGKQRLGQRFDVDPRLCVAKHELEDFIVLERVGARLEQALAQALAMAMIMRPFALVGVRFADVGDRDCTHTHHACHYPAGIGGICNRTPQALRPLRPPRMAARSSSGTPAKFSAMHSSLPRNVPSACG